MKEDRPYASVTNPSVAAAVASQYRYREKADAVERLQSIKTGFRTSKQLVGHADSDDSFVLWVKGFAVTPEEKEKGGLGNYAKIFITKTDDKKFFTLAAEKVESDIKHHPQRKREKMTHPNWGHPILRSVLKRRVYKTLEQANAELQQLHEQYPKVTIPGDSKLYIMIYTRPEKGEEKGPPIRKFTLSLKALQEGGVRIEYKENRPKPKFSPLQEEAKAPGANEPKGYFSTMVTVKKRRRTPPTAPQSRGIATPEQPQEAPEKLNEILQTLVEMPKPAAEAPKSKMSGVKSKLSAIKSKAKAAKPSSKK